MASYKWNGGAGDYQDPGQWTPNGVPLYGAENSAIIDSGEAALTSAEPNGITLTLGGPGGARLVLSNAAIGPQMTLDTTASATLGVLDFDTNYGQITLNGNLAIDTTGYGQFNQYGTITAPAGAVLTMGPVGVLNNGGLIDFSGGSGAIQDNIVGNGTIALDQSGSLDVAGAVGPGETFALNEGSLRLEDINGFRFQGTVSNFNSTADSLTIARLSFDSASYSSSGGNEYLALAYGGQTVGQIALSNTDNNSYIVTANGDGSSTITVNPSGSSSVTYTNGYIPPVITSGTVIIQNAEPNGTSVSLGSNDSASQPDLVLNNAALGAQLSLRVTGPGGDAVRAYGTLGVQGYDTTYANISIGGRPSAGGVLTIALGDFGQLNQEGTINVRDSANLTVNNTGYPGTLNNDGVINVYGASADILTSLTGGGSINIDTSAGGGGTVTLGGNVSSSQIINLNAGTLLLDQPMQFLGRIDGFASGDTALTLENTQADSATYQAVSPGLGELVVASAGNVVDTIALGGNPPASGYDVSYDPTHNATSIVPHFGS